MSETNNTNAAGALPSIALTKQELKCLRSIKENYGAVYKERHYKAIHARLEQNYGLIRCENEGEFTFFMRLTAEGEEQLSRNRADD